MARKRIALSLKPEYHEKLLKLAEYQKMNSKFKNMYDFYSKDVYHLPKRCITLYKKMYIF